MHYYPIIKTKQAELAAIEFLDESVKNQIIPIFELTTSRKTKLLPEGDIARSYGQLLAAYTGREFILDLTAHDDLQNSQIEEFFDPRDGYSNWCGFLESLRNPSIIPTIQIDVEEGLEEVTQQVRRLSGIHQNGRVVLRLPLVDPETDPILRHVASGLEDGKKLIIVLDGGYIRPKVASSFVVEIMRQYDQCKSYFPDATYIAATSSFPRTVTMSGYGEDAFGKFDLEEVTLHELLLKQVDWWSWAYSDYGSVHPYRYPSRGGGFVPRVDVPLEKSLFYHRHRRAAGGYAKASLEAVNNPLFPKISCWGITQIEKAARKEPTTGLSPSFWISVRINIHITTQQKRVDNLYLKKIRG